ncbi:nuclear transport factor 2 family protein [Caulobacter segnis]|uniref:nuclear transport factor 2 family protein n=1 Tax=Caulobacter segnis TaxID=88688 RepID=UPI001CBCA857|nr:nuclear transport factor 2 family protein [Caulobacter segnis]UAL10837.1 nuclear transport factor 2 family protein [Caulobacter segnis]
MLPLLIAAALAGQVPAPPPAADPEDKAVLAAAQAFFDGMAAADTEAMRAAVLPGAQFMGVRAQPDGSVTVRRIAFEDSYGKRVDPGLKEWMWSPVIIRRGGLATVTAPYEISRDGKTLHCGIDVFTLAKQDGAWKIASISWTAEPTACEELRKL